MRYLLAAAIVVVATAALDAQVRKPSGASPPSGSAAPARQPAAAKPARSTAELLAGAMEALRANDTARAAALFDAARAQSDFAALKPPVQLFVAAGEHHASTGTAEGCDTALKIYSQGLDVHADTYRLADRALLRLKRAEVMMRQGRMEQAREELAAIRRGGADRRAMMYADLGEAQLLLMASQGDAAREKLLPLTESEDPNIGPMALFALGQAYVQLKQTDQAVATFRTLWNRYGESEMVKRAIYLIGQIYLDRGDFLEARKLFEATSVVGAVMKTRVRPGDELIVKVYDPNYFSRTRSTTLKVDLAAPSGDRESVRLEKNPVSDQLYIGRIRTALGMPASDDGVLQVSGSDVIELTYAGQAGRKARIMVVDDGRIDIDSLPLPEPPPRGAVMGASDASRPRAVADDRPVLAGTRQTSGTLNPGSPVYVQVVDADLDVTDRPDTVKVEVVAQGGGKENVVTVQLTETGPRTGVFAGSVMTASSGPTVTASSEAVGHPAFNAIDVDRNSPPPATAPATRPVQRKGPTFWQARRDDKSPYLEIDLHQPASLGKLIWGAGDDPLAGRNMPTDLTITLRGGGGPDKVITLTGQSQPVDNVVELRGATARVIRLEFQKFKGEAPAIGQLIITDAQGNQLVPTGVEQTGQADKSVLEFNVGQTVFARYMDEENETPGSPVIRESRRLGARYFNGTLAIVKPSEPVGKSSSFHPAWRLDLRAAPHVLLTDPDLDITPLPDTAYVEVFTEAGDTQTVKLTETGAATGVFLSPLTFSTNPDAAKNPRVLFIRPGDAVWMRYFDERNMQPGYKTFRHAWLLENRPTAGDWQGVPAVATAWPFEIKATEEGEGPVVAPRAPGRGRISLSVNDPDALANAATAVSARITTLIGGADRELAMPCAGAGTATLSLDLVLADIQAERRVGETARTLSSAGELPVAGDDIIRLAYTDAHVATADLQVRRVAGDEATRGAKSAPRAVPAGAANAEEVIPIIRLADPHRRALAAQDARLATLRRHLNARLSAYAAERDLLLEKHKALSRNLAAATARRPATGPASPEETSESDALKAMVAALGAQIDLLNARMERLKALGAVDGAPPAEQPAAAAPAPEPEAQALIVPGKPFDVTVDDPDLTGPTVNVRLRSFAGRLIDTLNVAAQRDPAGGYRVRVPTKDTEDPSLKNALLVMAGGEVVADYADANQKPADGAERVAYIVLASDATLTATNASYAEELAQVRLGEPVYVQVMDFDADRSGGIDHVAVVVTSSVGDRLVVTLAETEPHSGIFRGKFLTDNARPDPNDEILQASYSGHIEIVYHDRLRLSADSQAQKIIRLNVAGGTDGVVEAFSRHFRDAQEELRLWHATGQSAYQIGRRLYLAGAYERAEEYLIEASDYFSQLAARFPDDPLAASANYYLGNIQSLKGNHREALARYQEVVTRWPKSTFVPAARFKIGQAYEKLGRFDEAADAFVLLTYHHPDDPHVPMAMIRMMNYYARGEQWADAVAIAQKFVEKFPRHEQAGTVALKAGQWLVVAGRTDDAVAWFTEAQKVFAASDRDMPGLLYWHAATLLHMQQSARPGGGRGAVAGRSEKIRELLQRVIYDYGRSEYAARAREALAQVGEVR